MSIVVITNNKHQVFQSDVITGIERMAHQYGLEVLVDSKEDAPFFHTQMSPDTITGMIIIANVLDDNQLATLFKLGKPMTLVSHRVSSLSIPAVIQNNRDGINKLVDYLVVDCGRRDFLFVQGDMTQHDGIARQQTFEQRLMHHNIFLSDECFIHGNFSADIASDSMQKALQQGMTFDTVVAADYLMGCAVVDVLGEAGLAVGDDVFVVGFGDGKRAIDCGLTTVGTDIIALGQRAARQLIAQIHGTPIHGVTWLNTELIERQTSHRLVENV